jgi:hypothetical protein
LTGSSGRHRSIALPVVLAAALLPAVALISTAAHSQDEPALPKGLEATVEEPRLPAGLGGTEDSGEPQLPAGLGDDEEAPQTEDEGEGDSGFELPFDLTGFVDGRIGHRTQNDTEESNFSLGEIRAQIEAEKTWDRAMVRVTFDLLYDEVAEERDVNLEKGRGWFDLREAFVSARATSFLDLKLGRQILTWGTGDLVFINDLFPKDYVSFFIGRDTEYLKAPSE